MIPFDELVPHYRRARDRWATAPALVSHYHTLLELYDGTGQALIEGTKSFVECVCRTIITDFGDQPAKHPTLTELLVAAMERLGLRNTRGASKFDSVLSAHNRLADALSDCRNDDGPLAHGKDGYLDALATHHVRMYLLTGDTILALLLGALDGTAPDLNHTREPYERFAHFNATIDRNVGVSADVDWDDRLVVLSFGTEGLREGIELRIEPSRLLYQLDRAAFIEVLDSLPGNADVDSEEPLPSVPAQADHAHFASSRSLRTHLIDSYSGRLAFLTMDLAAEVARLGLPNELQVSEKLVPSLLHAFEMKAGLDWPQRPALRAGVLVAFKHTLHALGTRQGVTKKAAAHLTDWFAARWPTGTDASPSPGDGMA